MTDSKPVLYALKREEKTFVESLCAAVRALLRRDSITAKEVYLSAVLLKVLARLPLVTDRVGIKVELWNRVPNGSGGCLELSSDEEAVCLSTCETFNSVSGSDHESRSDAVIGVGYRDSLLDYCGLEDWFLEFGRRAEDPDIKIYFEYWADLTVDWEDETSGSNLWSDLESDFA